MPQKIVHKKTLVLNRDFEGSTTLYHIFFKAKCSKKFGTSTSLKPQLKSSHEHASSQNVPVKDGIFVGPLSEM